LRAEPSVINETQIFYRVLMPDSTAVPLRRNPAINAADFEALRAIMRLRHER
jgi:hypothetical protein